MNTATMLGSAIKKSSRSPDETRTFPNGQMEVFHLQDRDVSLVTLRPGWKYSVDVGPIQNTTTCQSEHFQYVISGRLHVEMPDGTSLELGAGDFASIPPGHDAWVLGDDPFVAVDFLGMKTYARPPEEPRYMPDYDEIVGFD